MTVHVRLSADDVAEIDRIAGEEGRKRANLLVRLIREALESRKRSAKRREAAK